MRFLLDTHVVIRWVAEPRKLTRNQARHLEEAVRRREQAGFSAITLLEIAALAEAGRIRANVQSIFTELQSNPVFQLLPVTFDIAAEVAALGPALRDPADRTIVATARVHRLPLLTSDQRIIDSGLVRVAA